jgi:Zn-dependent protease with chaperone function
MDDPIPFADDPPPLVTAKPPAPVKTIPPAREPEPDDDLDESEDGAERSPAPPPSVGLSRVVLLVLMGCYFPVLVLLLLLAGGLAVFFLWVGINATGDGLTMVPGLGAIVLGCLFALTFFHFLWSLRGLFLSPEEKDELEIELPEQWQEGLHDLVERVAADLGVDPPDVVRLHAADIGHVYEDRKGRRVLVIGGLAVAAFSQRVLGGIVAHELGHFAGGDTRRARWAARWYGVIVRLEYQFARNRWMRGNPMVWVLRGYHLVFGLAWCYDSRQNEYAADRYEIDHVGGKKAAAALMLAEIFAHLPSARLENVAESCVKFNERVDQIFAEQVRRVKEASRADWDGACRKALRVETGWFDSHPCLKERLKAMGVSPKKALRLAMDWSGEPATDLFANWPVVEKYLTNKIMVIVRKVYLQKQELADTLHALVRLEERRG